MKTILYSIIAIFIFGTIAKSCTNKANTQNIIVIQTVESRVSSDILSQSTNIISKRLQDFSSNKFDVNVNTEKNQIQVTLYNDWDLNKVENLMIQKGSLAFYETYNRKSLAELLNGNIQLFSMLSISNSNDSAAEIGYVSLTEIGKINDYLKTLGVNQKCKFTWSQNSDSSSKCLYALKINNLEGALIAGSDIESVKYNQDIASKNNEIGINLKESAIELWAHATKRNINRAIAIVLDDNVLAAPIVRSVISGGHCTITGNYTPVEAKFIAALGNNSELPTNFKVVK